MLAALHAYGILTILWLVVSADFEALFGLSPHTRFELKLVALAGIPLP